MANAIRLPDPFSPGAAATNAATPTCCCCCCCCAVSSVGAAVHIPAALHQDTKHLERPRSLLVLPAAIYPLLIVVLPFVTVGATFDLDWGWWLGGFGVALLWATAAGFLAQSPKPWASVLRLLGWAALWFVELVLFLPVGGAVVKATHWTVGLVLYLGSAIWLGVHLFRSYRRKQ